MASLYELLCHLFLTIDDPLVEEFLSYLHNRFSPHIFDFIANESSDKESVRSINSSVCPCFSDNSTYFSKKNYYLTLLPIYATPISFYHKDGHKTLKKPPAENDRRPRRSPEGLKTPGSPRSSQVTPTAVAFPL